MDAEVSVKAVAWNHERSLRHSEVVGDDVLGSNLLIVGIAEPHLELLPRQHLVVVALAFITIPRHIDGLSGSVDGTVGEELIELHQTTVITMGIVIIDVQFVARVVGVAHGLGFGPPFAVGAGIDQSVRVGEHLFLKFFPLPLHIVVTGEDHFALRNRTSRHHIAHTYHGTQFREGIAGEFERGECENLRLFFLSCRLSRQGIGARREVEHHRVGDVVFRIIGAVLIISRHHLTREDGLLMLVLNGELHARHIAVGHFHWERNARGEVTTHCHGHVLVEKGLLRGGEETPGFFVRLPLGLCPTEEIEPFLHVPELRLLIIGNAGVCTGLHIGVGLIEAFEPADKILVGKSLGTPLVAHHRPPHPHLHQHLRIAVAVLAIDSERLIQMGEHRLVWMVVAFGIEGFLSGEIQQE